MQDPPTTADPQRKAILVLGMHRSGTSVLTRVLSLRGCALPRTLMPSSPTNETGYWESSVVKKLNNAVLSAAGTYWYDWRAVPADWLMQETTVKKYTQQGTKVLKGEFGDVDLLILKDPRIARIAPLWISILGRAGIAPNFVLALRNPNEVAASLQSRNGMTPAVSHLTWLHHMLQAEFDTRGHPRLVIGYKNLMQDWAKELGRAEEHLEVDWHSSIDEIREEVDALLAPNLRHFEQADDAFQDDATVSIWVRQAYAILQRWAVTGEDNADHKKLNAIRKQLAQAEATFAPVTTALHDANKKLAAQNDTLEKAAVAQKELAMATKRSRTAEDALRQAATAHAEEMRLLQLKVKSMEWDLQEAGVVSP